MRTPPSRTLEQQQEADRDAALRVGTPDALRAWAQKYNIPLMGTDDDELLLISIHKARAELFPKLHAKSKAWLKANEARIMREREKPADAEHPGGV